MNRVQHKQPYLTSTITQLDNDARLFKTQQAVGGDSLQGFLTASTSAYDWSTVIPGPAGSVENYIITFTPTTPNVTAIIQLFFYYSIDTSAVMSNAANLSPTGGIVSYTIQPLPPSGTASQWYLMFENGDENNASHTVYAKFNFSGTDTGEWSIASA